MPNKWPLANGNWNSATNWNGGTIPLDGDTIYLNGKTITLNVDISLPNSTIRNDASVPDGVVGGGTVTMSASRILTVLEARAFSSNSGNTPVIGMSANCHFIGNVTGGTATGNPGIYPVGSAGTRMITGNIIGGSAGNSGTNTASGIGTANFGGAIFIINGNVTGGSVSGACGIRLANNGDVVTVNGNVIGGSNSGCPGIGIDGTTCTIAVNGNVQGDTGRGVDWISTGSPATITVSGNSIGGSNIGIAIPSGATGSLTVTGNAIAGTATGVVNSATGFTCTINGIAIASTTAHGVSSSGPCVIGSSTTSSNGRPGSSSVTTFAGSGPTTLGVVNQTNGSITMVQSTALGDYPTVANVRNGTIYNYGTRTGTLAVPAANQVAIGVPVDNTVGTAILTTDNLTPFLEEALDITILVSPAAFSAPGKVTGRTLRPYYKDTSRLGPIGIADSTRTPIDLSIYDGDLYVSVMDSDTLEVLLYDDDPHYVTSNLYIDPSPESVGILEAPLCWALRRISNNQTLMEGPWEVQFAAYGTE